MIIEQLTHEYVATGHSDVAARVEQAFRQSGYWPLRNLRVSGGHSVVCIFGTVPTYHLKQLAQVAAIKVPGVHRVQNEVDVISS